MVELLERQEPEPGKIYLLRERFDLCPDGICDISLLTEDEKRQVRDEGAMYLVGVIQRADAENGNGRIYPYPILKREMDKYQQIIRENRAYGECVDGETEIWTTSGWKLIKNISENEEIFTLDVATNEITKIVAKKVVKDFEGEMLHIHNDRMIDQMLTSNHHILMYDRNKKPFDFYADQFDEQSDLEHSFFKQGGGIWKGEDVNVFLIPGTNIEVLSDRWAAFFGLYLAEGCVKDQWSVQITQKKEENLDVIRTLLDKLPFKWYEYTRPNGTKDFFIQNKELVSYLEQFGFCFEKFIPQEIKNWSPRLLTILVEWMLFGDGRNRKNPKGMLIRELATTSKRLAEDVVEIFFKLGNGGTVNVVIPKDRMIEGRMILAENSRPLFIACEHSRHFLSFHNVRIDKISYQGKVYCVSVPQTHTWMARRKGKSFWTFNCDHPEDIVVNLKNSSHRITEIWWKGREVWGKLKINVHTPAGQILKGLILDGGAIGLSSRALGSVEKDKTGRLIVQEDLQMICFDTVSEPSTGGAFMHLMEVKNVQNILKEIKEIKKGDKLLMAINEFLGV